MNQPCKARTDHCISMKISIFSMTAIRDWHLLLFEHLFLTMSITALQNKH